MQAAGGQGTADGVARIISLDFPTYASLLTVTAVLAPVLEETVFRGFLLTSLTKWMPTPAAVLVGGPDAGIDNLLHAREVSDRRAVRGRTVQPLLTPMPR